MNIKDKSMCYLQCSLRVITDYIKGNVNLTEATTELYKLGHHKKSIKKVLKNTERNNILNLKK